MIRDSKFSRRNSGKNLNFEETENVPVNVNLRELPVARMSIDSCSRPPLNTIQEPAQNPSKPDQELGFKSSKLYRTPTKSKLRNPESGFPIRTPEKQGCLARNRFGWGQDSKEEGRNGNLNTPSKTHSTPSKSASKPPNPSSKLNVNGSAKTSNFTALSKGIPVICNTHTTVNSIEVPHFDLREDSSFWMDHNVQVLIRVRPLNSMEISSQGYNRCLKQESAQCLTWVGHPETRFTFDHVACETIDQETLFKMVGLPMVENCLSGYNSCMFAYGQTGSGKTHTMLGEINDLEVKPSPYRGMTPRIFEFLFARIIAEEENRKDESLKYNCKCSFLEIYNEQITDLLDPSSTNLQLREDVKKGVYVENLTELEVHSVGDILRLLTQGSANRRVAATNMNRESSRSHSVFTCVIESRWEKDSTSNLRFARLNLVDLAGSERQKTSGAEGERLKEAANINKSLSTLGHVIMVLVDGINTRTRHVPYRDSKLTFLLQDSLGGNSKTMIIANVSPSISSATETLNTLKFAQRAKLIQNNAVINEDASGDVAALQHQIRLLKEELATLKRHNVSRSLTFSSKEENSSNASSLEINRLKVDNMLEDDDQLLRVSCKQLKSLESSLNGALRREKSTENCIKQLEEEIEQLNCLVHQREEENRCTKMMLKFREDKIQRMESVLAGSLTVDSYLLEENKTLCEEIRILRPKVDKNPEVTRFAVENIRLLEQLKRFQDFYEEGEREMLLTEVSELREQLVLVLDENNRIHLSKEAAEDRKEIDSLQSELKVSHEELEKSRNNLNSCLERNAKLCSEITDLKALLETHKSAVKNDQDCGIEVIKESISEISSIGEQNDQILANETEKDVDLQLEVEILKIILKEERLIRVETEEKFLFMTKQYENLKDELHEAKSVIEALETQQLVSINELEDTRNCYQQQCDEISQEEKIKMISSNNLEYKDPSLQAKLKKVQDSLEKTKKLNIAPNEEEMDEIRRQVEAETTNVIIYLQEEICSFQMQMQESILKEKENQQELTFLREKCEEKDRNIDSLSQEFDLLTNKIEQVLTVGEMALDDASNLIGDGKRTRVSEQLQTIARRISEKELKIEELNSCLENAKSRGNEMESMLRSLRGATLVMSEAHQQDCIKKDQEICRLLSYLNDKDSVITQLEEQTKLYELELMNARQNLSQQGVESCCYLDKFVETQNNTKEAYLMINKLVTDNEVMEMEISNQNQVIKAKEIELFIMLSKLDQLASVNHDLEKEKISVYMVLEKFKEDIITSHVDMALKDGILTAKDAEVCLLQKQVNMQEEALKMAQARDEENEANATKEKSIFEHEFMDAKLNAAQQTVESCCYLDKFLETQDNIKEADLMMKKLVAENEALQMEVSHQSQVINANELELVIMLSKLEQVSENNTFLEKFKEEIIISHVDLELKDLILKEKDAEVGLLQKQIYEHEENEAIATKEKRLYELEFMDAQLNAAQKAVESSCYLDKFVEAQHIIEGADLTIDKLVTENEAMKMEISHLNQVIIEKDEKLRCFEEKIVMGLFAKEIELFIMLSKVEQLASENNNLEKEKSSVYTVLEKFKEENIVLYVDVESKDCILMEKDVEVGLLQKQIKMQEEALSIAQACKEEHEAIATKEKSLYELELIEAKKNAAQQAMESCCYLDKFIETQNNVKEADLILNKLVSEIEEMKTNISHQNQMIKEKDTGLRCFEETLVTGLSAKEIELIIMLAKLKHLASENNDLEKENISTSMILEKFKEEIIISYVDLHIKDSIFLEKDAEVGLLQKQIKIQEKEHETLGVIIESQKKDNEEFQAVLEALEFQLFENNVKSFVLEARLRENVDEALKAKELTEGRLEGEILELTSVLDEKNNSLESLKKDIEEFQAALEALEFELFENNVKSLVFEARLLENVEDALKAKELTQGRLESQILELSSVLDEKDNSIESLKGDLKTVTCERYDLHVEVVRVKEDLELARARAKENEAIAMIAKQACETKKHYVEEKEEELKLYEKSVEELECTVNVLENQLDLVKGDAESQRLKREELQLELQKMCHQQQLLITETETIKEENRNLKAENDEISHKLRRGEVKVTRVKEELANFRAATGKNLC